MALLKSRGEDASGAFLASKRFEKRRCKHQEAVDEALCISQIISTSNPHNYVVATQSKKLRVQLAQVPGVPLLYINRANMILEPPSDASVSTSKKIESDKTHASSKELNTLKAVKVTALGKVSVDPKLVKKIEEKKESKKQKMEIKKAKIMKKRMGPKEPNPLSVKKKKAPATPSSKATATTTTTTTNTTTNQSTNAPATENKKRPSSDAATEGGASEKKKRKRRKSKSASATAAAAADGSESP
ncbi:hypothetical protein BGX26_001029 [Mortierella sp. AD094]|nr:hypothetical protein BGX26_001029 [Mortierella sp. AD094]